MKTRLYLVTRLDNDSGMVVRATSPEEAVRKVQKWAHMRCISAFDYTVRIYA